MNEQESKAPTFWQALWIIFTGFVTGTAGDYWRIRRALREILEWGLELVVVIGKLLTRWFLLLIGPVSLPLITWYALRISRIKQAEREAMQEKADQIWGEEP